MSNEQKQNWKAWPTKPGFYWFFGHMYGAESARKLGAKPELQPVKVVQGQNALIVHYWADFLHRNTVTGIFLLMQPPDAPALAEALQVLLGEFDDMLSHAEYIGLDMST